MSSPPPASSPPRTPASPGAAAHPATDGAPPPPVPAVQHSAKTLELHAMFPTIDMGVIDMVLESVSGSSDRAIEVLLGMTDPNFKPDELVGSRREEAAQVDLDEEFARSLQMQDAEALRAGSSQQAPLPYQPRVRRQRSGPGEPAAPSNLDRLGDEYYGQPQGEGTGRGLTTGQPPGMIALEEKLGNYAEVGKQTFTSFFNRAKAKVAELQATAAEPTARPNFSDWGRGEDKYTRSPTLGGPNDKYTTIASADRGARPPAVPGASERTWRAMAGGNRGGEQARGLWAEQRNQDNASARSNSLSSRSTSFSSQSTAEPAPAPAASSKRWQPSDAFDDPLPVPTKTPTSAGRRSPNANQSTSPDKPAAGKIDMSRLGFLPKKRVDLLSTSPSTRMQDDGADDDDPNPGLPSNLSGRASGPSSSAAGAPNAKALVEQIPKTPPAEANMYQLGDDEDDLEYTRNPFDEK